MTPAVHIVNKFDIVLLSIAIMFRVELKVQMIKWVSVSILNTTFEKQKYLINLRMKQQSFEKKKQISV